MGAILCFNQSPLRRRALSRASIRSKTKKNFQLKHTGRFRGAIVLYYFHRDFKFGTRLCWKMTSRRTKISPKSGRGLGHVTSTIFDSTVGYPSDSLASCSLGPSYAHCCRALTLALARFSCYSLAVKTFAYHL